jgi:O-antigen/teichoic acid export membrane protein
MHRAFSREALTVLAFSVGQVALGLISTRLLTQFAAPEALGEYYLYMNLSLWLTLPASSAYLYVWKNWTVARASGQAPVFIRWLTRGLGFQAAVCVVGCLAISAARVSRASWPLLVALSVVSMGQAINITLDQVQMLERRRVAAGILSLAGGPGRQLALAAGVLILVKQSGSSFLVTQCIFGVGVAALSASLFLIVIGAPYSGERADQTAPTTRRTDSVSRFLRFSVPFLVTGIATQAATSAERWGLALRADPGATALFVQAVGISMGAANAATLPINTYFLPIVSQAAARLPEDPLRTARAPLRSFLLLSAAALILATLTVTLLAGPLTNVFFGPRYRTVQRLLPWTMLGQSFFGLGQAVSVIPVTIEATTATNVVQTVSKFAYVGLLLMLPCPSDCVRWFSQCFAIGNFLYLCGMIFVATRAMSSRRPLSVVAL